jgi:hypothetical protein
VRPTGGATGFPRVHFQPKLKAYLESVAASQSNAAAANTRPLMEVFCEDLVAKQGTHSPHTTIIALSRTP